MALITCPECGNTVSDQATSCPHCGKPLNAFSQTGNNNSAGTNNSYSGTPSGKDRVTAGILAILIGSLGVHYFYLGKTMPGIVFLLFCCTGIPSVLALIQGILMLTMTDEQFDQKYVSTESSFPLF